MSTFALFVVVVGACIGVVALLVLRSDEPATSSTREVRGPRQPPAPRRQPADQAPVPARRTPARPSRPPEGEPDIPLLWWQRLRSAVVLTGLAVVLGVLAAAAIGLAVVALFGLLRGAV